MAVSLFCFKIFGIKFCKFLATLSQISFQLYLFTHHTNASHYQSLGYKWYKALNECHIIRIHQNYFWRLKNVLERSFPLFYITILSDIVLHFFFCLCFLNRKISIMLFISAVLTVYSTFLSEKEIHFRPDCWALRTISESMCCGADGANWKRKSKWFYSIISRKEYHRTNPSYELLYHPLILGVKNEHTLLLNQDLIISLSFHFLIHSSFFDQHLREFLSFQVIEHYFFVKNVCKLLKL